MYSAFSAVNGYKKTYSYKSGRFFKLITTVTLNPAVDHFVQADNFSPGHLNRVKDLERHPGGKGINIAMMLGAMGVETLATGFLGKAPSRFIQERLHRRNITTNFVHINGVTRHNYFIIDTVNDNRTLIDEEGPEITRGELDVFVETYKRLLHRSKIVIIAGSIPRNVPFKFYCKLVSMANEKGIMTILNTAGENMAECLQSKPYLIMPDLRSADEIMGIPVEGAENRYKAACSILEKATGISVVTFDGINFLASTPQGCLEASPPENVEIVSRLKTGDGMIAGMAYELFRGKSVRDAFKTGMACATATSVNLNGNIYSMEDISKYLDNVIVKEVTY